MLPTPLINGNSRSSASFRAEGASCPQQGRLLTEKLSDQAQAQLCAKRRLDSVAAVGKKQSGPEATKSAPPSGGLHNHDAQNQLKAGRVRTVSEPLKAAAQLASK
jgi:hypothetical protein